MKHQPFTLEVHQTAQGGSEMQFSDIAPHRMICQGLVTPLHENPAEVIAWQGAVQAQEYAPAKWALAQRTKGGISDAQIEQAFTDGAILRTHIMRPTWHFVSPADIRWMLALTGPRVNQVSGTYYRAESLDDATFHRSHDLLAKVLEGGNHLTRKELGAILQQGGIVTDGLRLSFLMLRAELDGIVCSGPRRGKQFTYALLDERVPPSSPLARDEAVAELTKRYFQSHGPALIKDFVWWSGLTVADAKAAIESLKPHLQHTTRNNLDYWFFDTPFAASQPSPTAYLLPIYDEAISSYKDYSASVQSQFTEMWTSDEAIFNHYIVIDGWVMGTWKRTLTKSKVVVELKPFAPWSDAESEVIAAAAQRFADFLGLSLELR